MTRLRLAVAALPLLLSACATAAPAPPASPPPSTLAARPSPVTPGHARFDWFEYTGQDEVFRRHVPGATEYRNPVLAGFYPDPSWVRVGDDYYLVTSSFSYFPGVPIFHSRDLVAWTQIGHVLTRPSQLQLDTAGVSRGIFAPAIRHHQGTFYLITTVAGRGNFLVTATDPRGPWSDPVWLPELNGTDGYDPSLFFDDDGRVYVVNNGPPEGPPLYQGHRAVWMQEYDPRARRMVGPRKLIINGGVDLSKQPVWIEAPHIFKVDGRYYLTAAEGGTADEHSQVILRADSVWGPYVPGPVNPILTQRHLPADRPFPVTSAGHADFVRTPSGEWWAVFLAVRPYGPELHNTGRETFMLPVRWENGWPVILKGDSTIPYTHPRPSLPAAAPAPLPTTGNFTVRDEFDGPDLPVHWQHLRTPPERFHALEGGALVLRARPIRLGTRGPLSFVGRRQQHTNAVARTVVRFAPRGPQDEAGLIAFNNDDFFLFLGVTQVDGRPAVQLVRRAGGERETVATAPLDVPAGAPVELRITARGAEYDFHYATTPGQWRELAGGVDGTILSSLKAGGFAFNFVGVMFSLYASGWE